jgi:hypothetical protein
VLDRKRQLPEPRDMNGEDGYVAIGGPTASAAWRETCWALLFLCMLDVLIVLPWHAMNHAYPIWDAASFVDTAQDIVASFHHGWLAGLEGSYLIRNWRPIIFPAIAAPFFSLTGGRVLLGLALCQLTVAILLTIYLFLLLKEFLSRERAVIGTVFILTTPWLLNFAYNFYSELLWLAATAAWAFHLVAGLSRKPKIHLPIAGVWLGIMGAARPAETVLIGSVPIIVLLLRELRQKRVGWTDLLVLVVQAAILSAAAYELIANPGRIAPPLLLFAAYAGLTALRRSRIFVEAPLLGLVVVAEVIFTAWHAPALPGLYSWAYETSFGPLAKASVWAHFTDSSPVTIGKWLIVSFGLRPLAVVGTVAAAALLLRRRFTQRDEATQAAKLILLALLMLAPILATLVISGTNDARRVMPPLMMLYVGITAVALNPTSMLQRTRAIVVLVIAALQTSGAMVNGMNLSIPALAQTQQWIGALSQPNLAEDANLEMMRRLAALGVRNGRLDVYSICYREPMAGCARRGISMIEPEAMTSVANEQGLSVYVNMARDLDFTRPDTLASQLLQRGYNYVLVDMFDKPDQIFSADRLPEHTFHFQAMIRDGLPKNIYEISKFEFLGREFHLLGVRR